MPGTPKARKFALGTLRERGEEEEGKEREWGQGQPWLNTALLLEQGMESPWVAAWCYKMPGSIWGAKLTLSPRSAAFLHKIKSSNF